MFLPLVGDLQHVGGEAVAAAMAAGGFDGRQKLHLDFLVAPALAFRAAAQGRVEGEMARLVAQQAAGLQGGEEFADRGGGVQEAGDIGVGAHGSDARVDVHRLADAGDEPGS